MLLYVQNGQKEQTGSIDFILSMFRRTKWEILSGLSSVSAFDGSLHLQKPVEASLISLKRRISQPVALWGKDCILLVTLQCGMLLGECRKIIQV